MKQGWEIKRLSEIGKVYNGNSINEKVKKDNYADLLEGFPFIATKDISYESIIDYENGIKIPFEEKTSFKTAPKNTVLICAEGGSAGRKIGITKQEVCFGNKLFALATNKNIDSYFVYYYYFSETFQKHFAAELVGIIGGVSMNKFKDLEIPLPPLPEQHRIVAILDKAFAAIAKAKANAEQNLKNAKELFESYLQGVFENKGEGWVEKTLKEVCAKITDGTHQTPKYFDEGVIFLSSKNVTSGKIDWDNIKYIDEKQHIEMHKRVAPRVGDILLAKNGTTGVAAMVDKDVVFDIYVSLAHIRVLDEVSTEFMLYFINSPVAKKQFNNRLKGAGVPNLHLEEIREVIIHFPKSKGEQQTIVRQLDALRTETKKLEAIYQQKINNLEELKKSILQKAFSGDLNTETAVV